MLSVSKDGPTASLDHQRHSKSRSSVSKRGGLSQEQWQENIHFSNDHDDPEEAARLESNTKLV